MGEAEINVNDKIIIIHSHIITYGNAADEIVTENIRYEIETMWNEPQGVTYFKKMPYIVKFSITAEYKPQIDMDEIVMNTNGCNNYFRIEKFAHGNISF